METDIVTLLGVPNKVLCFGGYSPTKILNNPKEKPKELILVVTGNPGVTRFYIRFAQRLHDKTKLPVWIVSHGGHEKLPVPSLNNNKDLYTLEGQIRQKKELISTYLQGVTLRCVGHSIGTLMLLNLLKDPTLEKQIDTCHMLFPTIERMVTTKNGGIFMFVYNYIFSLMIGGVMFLNLLPRFLLVIILQIRSYLISESTENVPATIDLLDPRVLRNVFFLAHDEMLTVLERDNEVISKNVHRLKFYYGATDGWTPLEYVQDLKKKIPKLDVEVDQNGYPHSFVLNHSAEVADLVAEWIKNGQSSGDSGEKS